MCIYHTVCVIAYIIFILYSVCHTVCIIDNTTCVCVYLSIYIYISIILYIISDISCMCISLHVFIFMYIYIILYIISDISCNVAYLICHISLGSTLSIIYHRFYSL